MSEVKKNSNLYIEAASVLREIYDKKGSLKTSVHRSSFQDKQMLTALVSQTLKYAKILETVIKRTKLLEGNPLLWNNEMLARTLLYDYMIGPGLFKPGRLKVVVQKNKESITGEFDRLLTAYGVQQYADLPCFSTEVLPRYVRVNLIKGTVEEMVESFVEEGWILIPTPADVDSFLETCKNLGESEFVKDFHLHDLLVFPAYTDFHNHHLVQSSKVILQDKASCLPAHILSPPEGAVVVDSCAAPGNKTSQLASLMGNTGTIYAFDHREERIAIFQERMEAAGVTCKVARCMDFLRVKTDSQTYRNVRYVVVDPSCSGSGIVNRLDNLTNDDSSTSKHRLEQLHKLQAQILRHAFSFPNVQKIVYSTCSVHEEENEQVCEEIYNRFKERFKIHKAMKEWPERGRDGYQKSSRYIRAYPEKTLTNGFFVACFKRRKNKREKTEENGVEREIMKDGQDESYSDEEEDKVKTERKKEKQMKRLGEDGNRDEETLEERQEDGEKDRAKKRKKDKDREREEEGVNCMEDERENGGKKDRAKKRKKDNDREREKEGVNCVEDEREIESGERVKRQKMVGPEENKLDTQMFESNQSLDSNSDCGNNSKGKKSKKKHKKKRLASSE